LNLNKNADISIFLKKEGKDISSQISIEFAFNIFHVLNNKVVATALLASLTAFRWLC